MAQTSALEVRGAAPLANPIAKGSCWHDAAKVEGPEVIDLRALKIGSGGGI